MDGILEMRGPELDREPVKLTEDIVLAELFLPALHCRLCNVIVPIGTVLAVLVKVRMLVLGIRSRWIWRL